jgi:hypothetical protein
MPYLQIYYLNGPDLMSSTAVFLDVTQTICAPDGYYSDGVNVRLQSSCSLLPAQACDTCGEPCFTEEEPTFIQSGGVGVYKIPINLGTNTGAVIIEFRPFVTQDGIMAEYNSNFYGTLSFQNYLGPVFSTTGPPVFIGDSSLCRDPQVVVVPEYIWTGTNFTLTPNNTVVNKTSSQVVDTGLTDPGLGIMVIPKPTASPQLLELTIYTTCVPSDWHFAVRCPRLLDEFIRTPVGEGEELYGCNLLPTENFYVAYVNGSSGQLNLYDWVFLDPYGQNYLPDGWYTAPIHLLDIGEQSFQVANGIVVDFDNSCPPAEFYYNGEDLYTPAPGCVSGGIISSTVSIDWQPLSENVYAGPFESSSILSLYNGVYTATVIIDFDAIVGCQDINIVATLTDAIGTTTYNQVFTPTAFGQVIFSYQFAVTPANGAYTLNIVLYPI